MHQMCMHNLKSLPGGLPGEASLNFVVPAWRPPNQIKQMLYACSEILETYSKHRVLGVNHSKGAGCLPLLYLAILMYRCLQIILCLFWWAHPCGHHHADFGPLRGRTQHGWGMRSFYQSLVKLLLASQGTERAATCREGTWQNGDDGRLLLLAPFDV